MFVSVLIFVLVSMGISSEAADPQRLFRVLENADVSGIKDCHPDDDDQISCKKVAYTGLLFAYY